MRPNHIRDINALLAKGPLFATVVSGRYRGSVGPVTKIHQGRGYSKKPVWTLGEVEATTNDKYSDYIYNPSYSIKLTTADGRSKTISTGYAELEGGEFEAKFVDESENSQVEIKDIFGRVLEVGSLVAFVQNDTQKIGIVQSINYLGHAEIKQLKGYTTTAKILQGNCVVIDKYVEDAALMMKLAK